MIGNMWFLWLAGFILEDNWGRLIYSIFYLVAGAAALQFYAWCAPGSYIPLVGASGAVAALMGGFLVRFPRMKIEMGFYSLIFRHRFKAPAYALLPFWLGMEFLYGSVSGTSSRWRTGRMSADSCSGWAPLTESCAPVSSRKPAKASNRRSAGRPIRISSALPTRSKNPISMKQLSFSRIT